MADKGIFQNPTLGDSKVKGAKFLIGRVKDIVLGPIKGDGSIDQNYQGPKDIGKVHYEVLYSNLNISNPTGLIQPAYPMFGFLKQYPLLGETIYIVPGPDSDLNDGINRQGYWYFPPYNVWNSPQHNIFPNMEDYAQFVVDSNAKTATRDKSKMVAIPAGKTFTEKKDIRTLRPFEGDVIIESRFGQSIRFGSTVVGSGYPTAMRERPIGNPWSTSGNNGNPIIIIRNGQGKQDSNDYFDTTVENIDDNDSTIWMTSDQVITPKDLSEYQFASYGTLSKINATVTELTREIANPDSISPRNSDFNPYSTTNIV